MNPLGILNAIVRPGSGVRFCLAGGFLLAAFHPASPLRTWGGGQPPLVALAGGLAVWITFEVLFDRWSGARDLRRARVLYRNGQLQEARALLRLVVERRHQTGVAAEAATLLAGLDIEEGRFAEAGDWIRQARHLEESRPAKAHHLALEGLVNHLLGQPREALSRLESAGSMHPKKPVRGLIQLGHAALQLFHEQRPAEALRRLDQAAALSGHPLVDRVFPWITALALAEANLPVEAQEAMVQARGPVGLSRMVEGRLNHLDEHLDNAARAYEEALATLAPGFLLYRAWTRFQLGCVLTARGQIPEGSQQFHEALQGPLPKPLRHEVPRWIMEQESPVLLGNARETEAGLDDD